MDLEAESRRLVKEILMSLDNQYELETKIYQALLLAHVFGVWEGGATAIAIIYGRDGKHR